MQPVDRGAAADILRDVRRHVVAGLVRDKTRPARIPALDSAKIDRVLSLTMPSSRLSNAGGKR